MPNCRLDSTACMFPTSLEVRQRCERCERCAPKRLRAPRWNLHFHFESALPKRRPAPLSMGTNISLVIKIANYFLRRTSLPSISWRLHCSSRARRMRGTEKRSLKQRAGQKCISASHSCAKRISRIRQWRRFGCAHEMLSLSIITGKRRRAETSREKGYEEK